MKTATLNLKRKVLLIELPRLCDYGFGNNLLYVYDREQDKMHEFKGSYNLLGSPDDLKEEDVVDLVAESKYMNFDGESGYVDYKVYPYGLLPALESFNSALEKEIFWKNPFGKEKPVFNYKFPIGLPNETIYENAVDVFDMKSIDWHEAESRTFVKNRTLIFVEN